MGHPTRSALWRLAWGLIMSKLFYNVHVWSYFSGAPRRALNVVYMRVWRRIANCPRFNGQAGKDVEVRKALNVPSIDCYMRKRRLAYLCRLVACDVAPLLGILQIRDSQQVRLPWCRLVLNDLQVLYASLPSKLAALGDPSVYPDVWMSFLFDYQREWRDILDCYHTCLDDVDQAANKMNIDGVSTQLRPFSCARCDGVAFETEKQLLAHQRAKHGLRSPVVALVGNVSTCPVCGNDFRSRLRLISHLSETRIRSKHSSSNCRLSFLATRPSEVPAGLLARLNKIDADARRTARRQGRTHEIATVPAKLSATWRVAKAGKQVRRRINGKTPVERTTYGLRRRLRSSGSCA